MSVHKEKKEDVEVTYQKKIEQIKQKAEEVGKVTLIDGRPLDQKPIWYERLLEKILGVYRPPSLERNSSGE